MFTKCNTSAEAPKVKRSLIERLTTISQLKIVLLIIFFFGILGGQKIFAQGVGISEVSITPDLSAILELRHESGPFKGFLAPRMTTVDREGIAAPAQGLLVYDTDTKTFWYFDGVWVTIPATVFGASNQVLGMNDAGTANEFKTLYGTTNQISISHGVDSITFSTPQDIDAGATPTFFGLTLSDLDANSGVYTDALSALTSTPPSSGTIGYWGRAGTTLSPSNVGDNITTTGNLNADGTVTLAATGVGTNVRGTLDVDEDANFDGNVDANNGVDITGADLIVATNTDLNGTLDVAGQTDLAAIGTSTNVRGDLNVAEQATFTENIDANNGIDVLVGDLNVTENVNVTGNTDLTGTLNVDGNVDANAGVDVTAGSLTTSNGVTTILGDGQVTIAGNIDAANGINVTTGNVNISDNLNVSTNADITGTLNVDGATTLNGAVDLGNEAADVVDITGETNINGGNLTVDAPVTTLNSGVINLGTDATDNINISGEVQGASPIILEGFSDNDFETTISLVDPSQDNTIRLPDKSGTVVLSGAGILNNDLALSTDNTGRIVTAEDGQAFNVNSDAVTLGNAGTDQITAIGNVDATNGLDVTTSDLTVGGTNFTVDNSGNVDAAGILNVDGATTVTDLTASGTVNLGVDAIQTGEIQDGAVTSIKIFDNTIAAIDIGTAAVGSDEIIDNSITVDDIGTDAVDTDEIALGAVTTVEILDETILSEDIFNETILAEDINTGAVTTSEILNETILSEDIFNGT
ncbi:MAG: hypothetical protein KAS71_07090, partial [Bacteroidales bacterium]|nr:hypothetical protein [Bacteroidales bacterium]